jgi:hypothetical protein
MGDFCGGDGESAFSMTVMIGDQARTGPSLCFLDVIIGPVEAVVLFVLVALRLATVAHLPSTGVSIMSATTVADKVQLILVSLLAILPLISMLIIPGDVESGAQVCDGTQHSNPTVYRSVNENADSMRFVAC